MSGSRGFQNDDAYSPRLVERVTRVEEKQVALQAAVNDGFRAVNDKLDEKLDTLAAALAAKPIVNGTARRVETIVMGIGIAFAALVIMLLLLWIRLGLSL